MSTAIAKKYDSLRSYKLLAIVSTVAVLICVFSIYGFSSQDEKTSEVSDDSSQIWIEKQQLQRGDRWYNGPTIYRAKDRPLFFFLQVSSKLLELDEFVPFFIVINASDSMAILSDVAAESYRGGWSSESAGRFRMIDGEVVHISQWFEAMEDENGQLLSVKTLIRVGYAIDGKEMEHLFDHKEGCVVVITYDDARRQFNVEQQNVKLPSKDVWQKLTGMDSYSPTNYQLLHDWWVSLGKEK